MSLAAANQIQRPGAFDSTHLYLKSSAYWIGMSQFAAKRGGAQDWLSWAKLQAPASLTKWEQWVLDQYGPWLAAHPADVVVGVNNGSTSIYSVNFFSVEGQPSRSERTGTVEQYLAWAGVSQAEIDRRKLVAVQLQYLDWRATFMQDAFDFFAERNPQGDPAFSYWVPPGADGGQTWVPATGAATLPKDTIFAARNTRNDRVLGSKLFLDRFNYAPGWFDNLIGGAIITVTAAGFAAAGAGLAGAGAAAGSAGTAAGATGSTVSGSGGVLGTIGGVVSNPIGAVAAAGAAAAPTLLPKAFDAIAGVVSGATPAGTTESAAQVTKPKPVLVGPPAPPPAPTQTGSPWLLLAGALFFL